MTDTKPADVNGLIAPLHPAVFRNPARGGSGNQHPFGAAIPTAQRLASTGATISVDLADMLPSWPYAWPGMSSWLSQVNSFMADLKTSGLTNWYGIEPWNEPDGTWSSSNGDFNSTLWKQTYSAIRSSDPNSKVVGPCYSYYSHSTVSTFLSYCKANDCVPDIMCWHELGGPQSVGNNVKDYRSLESSLGITALPISINEYCDSNHNLEGQPGSLGEFIGKFERYKIDSAMISWWFTASPGRLGSLLATDTAKGAGWYFMNWYGSMAGNMVNVAVANDANTNMDGAACVDADARSISSILGGANSGTVDVTFKNMPSFIGDTASVKVEKIDWTSKDTVSSGPTMVSSSNPTVSNGQITVTMTGCNASSGYRISITSASGGAEATGGASSTGGSTSTGGAKAIGGTVSVNTGGSANAGGSKATGGAANTGGAPNTGGVKATGGSTATSNGGTSSTGGAQTTSGSLVVSTGGSPQNTGGFSNATGGTGAVSSVAGGSQVGGMLGAGGTLAASGARTSGGNVSKSSTTDSSTNTINGDATSPRSGGCSCRAAGDHSDSKQLALVSILSVLTLGSTRRTRRLRREPKRN